MITDSVVKGIDAFLEDFRSGDLAGATISLRDDDADLTYPAIIVSEDGQPEQHELLRNEWTVPAMVTLKTIPEDTTEEAHQLMTENLAGALGNIEGIKARISERVLCHDLWGGQGATEEADRYRVTEFPLEARVRAPKP